MEDISVYGDKSLNYVRLDVGGHFYTTHKNTLKKFEDSMLAKLVAPEHDKRKSSNDIVKIDRNGKVFSTILDYLRDEDSLQLCNLKLKELKDLHREADYYMLTELVNLCSQRLESTAKIPVEPLSTFEVHLSEEELVKKIGKLDQAVVVANSCSWLSIGKDKMQQLIVALHPMPFYFYLESPIIGITGKGLRMSVLHKGKQHFGIPRPPTRYETNYSPDTNEEVLKFILNVRTHYFN